MILGVGLSKTGTKSLNKALQILGYKSLHFPSKQQLFSGNYEAFTDIPCYAYLTQLLAIYPNTKLICTTRNVDTWIESCEKFFKPTDNAYLMELRKMVYGDANFNKSLWIDAFHHHHFTLSSYPNILYLPVNHNDKWQLLCNFLSKPLPNVDYPKL